MTTPIPQPPTMPIIGNLMDMDSTMPLRSDLSLAREYGEIFRFSVLGFHVIFCSSYELQNELSDDTRFKKVIAGSLHEIRRAAGDGLFTADLEDPNWGKAHRILMPAFGPASIAAMYDNMMDTISQLTLKWERFGPDHVFEVSEDFTRLAFDTLSLCAMGHRLNSFYTSDSPVFVKSMGDFLTECFHRIRRPKIVSALMRNTTARWNADADRMIALCHEIIQKRKAHSGKSNDLLDRMLNGRDPQTGEGLSDENIVYQLLTFLIAGHETTSGVLSFVVHFLLTRPESMSKLRAEVDTVIGNRTVTLDDINKMPYLTAVIREAMRLYPPVAGRIVVPRENTTLCEGKYAVKAGEFLLVSTYVSQRDEKVWGDDASEFKPERMLGDKFDALPPNAWQPFGFGMRGCIGRPFAWQEMHLALPSIIQKFDLHLADPSAYSLTFNFTLTIKSIINIRAVPRKGRHVIHPVASSALRRAREGLTPAAKAAVPDAAGGRQPLYVLYGSNTGSCESFSQRIANAAPTYGFSAQMGTMDSASRNLPTDGPVIIITASYEGQPPDNAGHFLSWLTGLKEDELVGVNYSVFGAGNRDWVNTYQRIPKLCDETIEARGGHRMFPRGEGDASSAQFFEAFDTFQANLWDVLTKAYGTQMSENAGLKMKLMDEAGVAARASTLRHADVSLGKVTKNLTLTAPGVPAKHHMEFELPEGMGYRAGDYLAILPVNPEPNVRRALARFGLHAEQEILLSADGGPTSLPVDKPIAVGALVRGYVELSQTASLSDLRTLAPFASSEQTKTHLNKLATSHSELVMPVRLSVLDLLEQHTDINIPFPAYLQLLPSMRVRQYSISSSPLHDAAHATLTLSIVQAPSLARADQPFFGVGSSYLAGLLVGDRVALSVRSANAAFRLPEDPTVPVVMFCAGSGLAPFRGFVQERARQRAAGRETRTMLLFYGCRAPGEDFLYADAELKEWTEQGVVDVRPAFSRRPNKSHGCKYVQDRVIRDKTDVKAAFDADAKFFVCGTIRVAVGVKAALQNILVPTAGLDFEQLVKGRWATDIFE